MNTILDHEYTGPQFYTDAYEPLYPAFHSLPLLFAAAFGSLLLTRQRPLFQYPPRLLSTIIMLYSALHTAALPIANHPKRNNESLCVSPSWEQIVIFILVNYVTHAVTIKTYPGERKSEMAICIAAALLWPYTGAFKGFRAIWTGARFAGDPLQMALRAEALCVVARNPKDAEDLWSPEFSNETDEDLPECKRVEVVEPERVSLPTSGDPNMPVDINGNRYEWRSNPKTWKVHGHCHISEGLHLHRLTDETIVQLQGCWRYQDGVHPAAKVKIIGDGYNWRVNPNISKVHGQFYLPKGYHLHRLVDNERVEKESENDGIDISSSISTPKVIASLIQICASIVTLYRARGMQLELFGWGTFGLSVIPYALMSIVNLFGNLISPEYSAVYMVRSEVMDEAISRGGRFVGTVGVMQPIYRRIVNENERPQATAHPIARTTQATPSIPVARRTPSGRLTKKPRDVGNETVYFKLNSQQNDLENISDPEYSNHNVYMYDANSPMVIAVPALGCRENIQDELHQEMWKWIVLAACAVVVATPYIIIYALTKYHRGTQSTGKQRAFMEAWLVIGQIAGVLCIGYIWISNNVPRWKRYLVFMILACIGGVSSIGGFVMVGLEISKSQLCVII